MTRTSIVSAVAMAAMIGLPSIQAKAVPFVEGDSTAVSLPAGIMVAENEKAEQDRLSNNRQNQRADNARKAGTTSRYSGKYQQEQAQRRDTQRRQDQASCRVSCGQVIKDGFNVLNESGRNQSVRDRINRDIAQKERDRRGRERRNRQVEDFEGRLRGN